jgi:cytochrome P450
MSNAAKEFLRYDGSSNIVIRVATEDMVLHGKTIKPGDVIMCMLGSANRDPEAFPHPDQLDITREDIPHTTYGGGRHHCIGAQLANMEIEVAFERLLARYSRIETEEQKLAWLDRVNLRGLHHFPVTVQR